MSDKTITIGFTDLEYDQIQKKAQSLGFSITQYIKSRVIPGEFNEKYEELLQKVKHYHSKKDFSVKSLWEQNEWENISRGVKLSLGKHFYRNVIAEKIDNVKKIGFGEAGIMLYKKTINSH